MAVDVPDSFIARNKTPPRYPPPLTNSSQVIKKNYCNNHNKNIKITTNLPKANGVTSKPIPPPRDHLHIEKDGRLINKAPAPQIPDRKVAGTQQIGQILEPTPDQLDSIKKFQVNNNLFVCDKRVSVFPVDI